MGEADAGADALAPQAPGAEPLPFPRPVIRGKSSDTGTPQSDGKGFGALTDYLDVTFRLPPPDWKDPAAGFFYRLTEAVGSAFGIMEEQGRGLHGYGRAFRFDRGGVRFAFGGQRNTALLSIPGDACALVPDWAGSSWWSS